MTQSPHIIVVDDEAPAREMVGEYLKMHGFAVTLCDGGKTLREAIESSVPDLVVLDLNMPEEDGLSIIRDLKSRINVPVIMLTATASPIDRVVGLELGADDYIAKPCELRELMARIRSVLRRSAPNRTPAGDAKASKEQLVRFGTKWLDLAAQALRDDEGNEHPLTASEFGLLKVFAANPKRVLSRERLLELANARDAEAFDRAVDLRIMRIRRKIEIDPTKPAVIRTIRGGGYLFSPAGENKYPPPLMVRMTAGLVGSISILRLIRMMRRSTARSNASLSRALASSKSRSRDNTRFGLAANTLSRPNSEAVSGCSLPSSSRSACASRSSHLVPNRTSWSFAAFAAAASGVVAGPLAGALRRNTERIRAINSRSSQGFAM